MTDKGRLRNSQARREALLTVHHVAERCQVQQRTVRRWIKKGLLPAVRLGRRRLVRIHAQDLDVFVRGRLM